MNKIKFSVIGCGNIGSRHLAVIDNDENAQLDSICDIDLLKCEKYSNQYGNIPYYQNYEDLLKNSGADVVNICTPHGLHCSMSKKSSFANKHVLVEKPLALNLVDAIEMTEAAQYKNKRLMVVKQNRYNIPITLTHNALQEGRLGKIYMCNVDVLWNRNVDYYKKSNWRGKKP